MKKMILMAFMLIAPVFAFAGGYDAGVYQQQGGQIMQQGSARTMTVLATRAVQMEVAGSRGQAQSYAITAAGAVLGGMAGSKIGRGNGSQAGAVLGGLLGGIAGNMAADVLSGPKTIEGQEITLHDPSTNQVVVVVQGGKEQFAEGQEVLAIQMGGTYRIHAAPRYVAAR